MGSAVKDAGKGFFTGDVSSISKLAFGDFEGGARSGKSAALRAQKRQTKLIEERQKKEDALLAEGESEVKRRQALARRGKAGRRSLIATSETGLSTNLGGSNGAA